MIIRNRVRCKSCQSVIESKHRHDFVWCACKSIAVDGGRDYLKRVGNLDNFEELSETDEDDDQDMLFPWV